MSEPLAKPWFVSALWMGILAASHAQIPPPAKVALGAVLTLPLLAGFGMLYADYWRDGNWSSRAGWYPDADR